MKSLKVFGVCKDSDMIGFPVEDTGSSDQVCNSLTVNCLPCTIVHIGCFAVYWETGGVQKWSQNDCFTAEMFVLQARGLVMCT